MNLFSKLRSNQNFQRVTIQTSIMYFVYHVVNIGAFDLLKNEGQDITTSVVQYLIYKTVSGTG